MVYYISSACVYFIFADEFGGVGVREGGEDVEEGEGEGGGWDVDDELDIPEDIGDVGPAVSGEEGYFVPPTKGSPPSQASPAYMMSICSRISFLFLAIFLCLQMWVNRSQLAGDHVTAGSFETAMRVSSTNRVPY